MTGKAFWKPLKGFENYYKINKLGQIKSLKRKYVPKDYILNNKKIGRGGYFQVSLTINNKQSSYFLHRLLAQTFIDNPNNDPVVNHIDGNKLNNNLSNLEWTTVQQNTKHAYNNFIDVPTGKESPIIKYEIQIFNQEGKYVASAYGQKEIEKLGFDSGNVYKCLQGKRKSHKKHTFKKIIL